MYTKSILLGGALAVALCGTGFAQTANQATTTTHPQTAHHAMVHHYRHHVRRIIRSAALHMTSTPAERGATRDLNLRQVDMAQSGLGAGYAQGGARYGTYPAEPRQANGLTPLSQIPNGAPYQSLTPAGGRQDSPALDQAHAR